MPSLFGDLNVALRAVQTHQISIEVTEHNVANANTAGYHRQEAVLAAGLGYTPPTMRGSPTAGMIGGGVMVQDIRRFTTALLDNRYRTELASSKRWDTQSSVLQQVEATMAETDSSDGLVAKLDAFWAGWQALSADPSNMAARADLKERAANLTDGFHRRAQALNSLRTDQDTSILQRVQEINQSAASIARLNVEISRVQAAEEQPNDLLDQRDKLADRLCELTGATATTQPNGEMLVAIGGSGGAHSLVFGSSYSQLVAVADPSYLTSGTPLTGIQWDDGQPVVSGSTGMVGLANGELAGLIDARDRVIPNQLAGLNEAAQTLATQVNTLHQTGYGLNGNTTGTPPGYDGNFFAPFAPASTDFALGINLSVNITSNLSNIAAASAAGTAPGDGTRADALANLQYQQITWTNGDVSTINQFYTTKVGELGLEGQKATMAAADRKLVADSLDQQRQSENGVSLDEEAAKLMQSQRSYQAATRLINAIDDMMDRIINGMGRVGI
jgi:flagellar hook-associated protein 1